MPSSPTSPYKADTPTYSLDRARLSSSYPELRCPTEQDARMVLAQTAIYESPPFQQKFQNDWSSVLLRSNGGYDLDVSLKKCYAMAFAMPPSPDFRARSNSVNSQGNSEPVSLSI
eukprot:CAMPEP_0197835264 /NCGR_PEP_ID=MMETSP1437-20131217/25268_1 /TAXON_ID=49252 ORGANISM="Eucampia antarctica, Strain CCMP1452" /NCGR_SAMPLE_ID=MMETSP1437 /ASSEMBLY_ACC=CAM_ASM_001096 /LENGTH=114 /DNA_ID=CAMNT_0043440559 /DNA_START=28 /DNA_END=372 /DNA_ORIENTATION=+